MDRTRSVVGIALGVAVIGLIGSQALGAPRYSDWSDVTELSAVNTPALEFANAISKDGLSFYFQRGDATVSGEDIWVVHRANADAPWGTPEPLPGTVNSASNDRAAFVSADGHWLYFASNRPGGRGGFDLMVSWRQHVHDDSAWEPAVNLDDLGAPVNTPGFDSGPTIFMDEATGTEHLYLVSNPTGPQAGADVYLSLRPANGDFSAPSRVAELSTPSNEGRPYIRHDGLEILFNSNRPGGLGVGTADIWVATRSTTTDTWSPPQVADGINTADNEITPVLSWDAQTLYFASNRSGLTIGTIYYATRTKETGKP